MYPKHRSYVFLVYLMMMMMMMMTYVETILPYNVGESSAYLTALLVDEIEVKIVTHEVDFLTSQALIKVHAGV